jgi:hypothetical protein
LFSGLARSRFGEIWGGSVLRSLGWVLEIASTSVWVLFEFCLGIDEYLFEYLLESLSWFWRFFNCKRIPILIPVLLREVGRRRLRRSGAIERSYQRLIPIQQQNYNKIVKFYDCLAGLLGASGTLEGQ